MRASELVAHLQLMITEHGDLPVAVHDYEFSVHSEVARVEKSPRWMDPQRKFRPQPTREQIFSLETAWVPSGARHGAVAQLGERVVRNDEAAGSIPASSTISRRRPAAVRTSKDGDLM